MSWLNDFIELFYPGLCEACHNRLQNQEESICTSCIYSLPQTKFHQEKDNDLSKVFAGRLHFENVVALYHFRKETKVQKLLHQLKYKGKKEIGVKLGKIYGFDLRKELSFHNIDLILPVPLHTSKQIKRGYNQSELFAKGLALGMGIPYSSELLLRALPSETQTKKSKFERWKNVNEIFIVPFPEKLEQKHVLLVDDVITTGATIESCAEKLLAVSGLKISIASIAFSGI